jgi:two-component system KDP operon response regulator KdpE
MSPSKLARRVLVIDDEREIRAAVRTALCDTADHVLGAGTFADAMRLIHSERPDLILLDLGLPDYDGGDGCREIRAVARVPIIVLTARTDEREKVRLFDLGADDYITKPFSLRELEARVRAQLRRAALIPSNGADLIARADDLEIDVGARTVFRAGTRISVTPIEWAVLRTLLEYRGRTLTHRQLSERVWPQEFDKRSELLRFHIVNLRRKMERHPSTPVIVVTEPGVGYRMELDPQP